MKYARAKTRPSVFGWPIVLAVLSSFGLIVGLLGEGWRDLLCWIGIGACVTAILWAWTTRTR